MNLETTFSATSIVAMVGWLLLLVSPYIPIWSNRIAGYVIPVILSVGYLGVILLSIGETEGGYGSLAEVIELFSFPISALAGWVHFLAFDLFIGAWICRNARAIGLPFWIVVPCLVLTLLLGPLGLLLFLAIRVIHVSRQSAPAI